MGSLSVFILSYIFFLLSKRLATGVNQENHGGQLDKQRQE
jgi:hypothetical protein